MTTAPIALTNAHGAVMATRAARKPVHNIEGSGFPVMIFMVK